MNPFVKASSPPTMGVHLRDPGVRAKCKGLKALRHSELLGKARALPPDGNPFR